MNQFEYAEIQARNVIQFIFFSNKNPRPITNCAINWFAFGDTLDMFICSYYFSTTSMCRVGGSIVVCLVMSQCKLMWTSKFKSGIKIWHGNGSKAINYDQISCEMLGLGKQTCSGLGTSSKTYHVYLLMVGMEFSQKWCWKSTHVVITIFFSIKKRVQNGSKWSNKKVSALGWNLVNESLRTKKPSS